MVPFAVAGIQMKVNAIHSNLPLMRTKLEILMSIYPWVEMVMFSELCTHGPLLQHASDGAEYDKEFARLAKKHGIWLLPGSIFIKEGDKVYNQATVFNPKGEIVGRYRKMFPFLPYEEGVEAGEGFPVV